MIIWPHKLLEKSIDDSFTEADLEKLGFNNTKVGVGDLDIWMLGKHRILYNPITNKVQGAYHMDRLTTKYSIDQVNEILSAIQHLGKK